MKSPSVDTLYALARTSLCATHTHTRAFYEALNRTRARYIKRISLLHPQTGFGCMSRCALVPTFSA